MFAEPLDVTLDRNVEAGRSPARVGAHENLVFADHEVLIARGDAGEAVQLHIHRRPLDGVFVTELTARIKPVAVAFALQAN